MSDEMLGFRITDKGLRMFIAAFEYSLELDPIDTSKMGRNQLGNYHDAIRDKANLVNNPDRDQRFKAFLSDALDSAFAELARNN